MKRPSVIRSRRSGPLALAPVYGVPATLVAAFLYLACAREPAVGGRAADAQTPGTASLATLVSEADAARLVPVNTDAAAVAASAGARADPADVASVRRRRDAVPRSAAGSRSTHVRHAVAAPVAVSAPSPPFGLKLALSCPVPEGEIAPVPDGGSATALNGPAPDPLLEPASGVQPIACSLQWPGPAGEARWSFEGTIVDSVTVRQLETLAHQRVLVVEAISRAKAVRIRPGSAI